MTIPVVTISEPLRAERECGCPAWAVRCAHIDGTILILEDDAVVGGCKHVSSDPDEGRYGVYEAAGFGPCDDCGEIVADVVGMAYDVDDYDEALAAFYEAEEALPHGEPS